METQPSSRQPAPSPGRGHAHPGGRRPRAVLLTARDRDVLELAAEHRLVLPDHAAALLGVSGETARARLRRLAEGGYLALQPVFAGHQPCCQITRRGLAVIGSDLPVPRLDLRGYAHDVGLAWLWLAARQGRFGPAQRVVSERTMRSGDGAGASEPLGVRLGGAGPHGARRLHYPDLLVLLPGGKRVALELELTSKGRARRDQILAGYGGDPRVECVLYLVEQRRLGAAIEDSARRLGIGHLVGVQRIAPITGAPPVFSRCAERVREL